MDLLFATTNIHKTAEIIKALPVKYRLLTLKDINLAFAEVDEPYHTLEENAIHKAISYRSMSGKPCFAEDTGLEVASLNGRPGVQSARYAGIPVDNHKNIEKLLNELMHTSDRNARFRTIIVLTLGENHHLFEGICNGHIVKKARGENGFGYDSVFVPDGTDKTFAEMTMEEKNRFSHRKKALDKLIDFLANNESLPYSL
jgi:XTP/dITP diphosphohydrolase